MAQTDSRPMKAVVNSTPLIALSMLNHLFVLKDLFDEIFVPAESFPLPPELLGLDTGEMDVILLAREVKADWGFDKRKKIGDNQRKFACPVKFRRTSVAYLTGVAE